MAQQIAAHGQRRNGGAVARVAQNDQLAAAPHPLLPLLLRLLRMLRLLSAVLAALLGISRGGLWRTSQPRVGLLEDIAPAGHAVLQLCRRHAHAAGGAQHPAEAGLQGGVGVRAWGRNEAMRRLPTLCTNQAACHTALHAIPVKQSRTCTTFSLPASYASCSAGRAAATSAGRRSGASGPCSSNCKQQRKDGNAAEICATALEGVWPLLLALQRQEGPDCDASSRRMKSGRRFGQARAPSEASTWEQTYCRQPPASLTSSMPLASTLVGGRALVGSSTKPVTTTGVVSGAPPALQRARRQWMVFKVQQQLAWYLLGAIHAAASRV